MIIRLSEFPDHSLTIRGNGKTDVGEEDSDMFEIGHVVIYADKDTTHESDIMLIERATIVGRHMTYAILTQPSTLLAPAHGSTD